MVKALLLKTTGEVLPLELHEDTEYPTIRDAVGGWIDAVSAEELVGYVHDEGLLIGLPANVMASVIFSRPLVGDVVIVGGLNAQGKSDGESHDVPPQYLLPEFASMSAFFAASQMMTDAIRGEAERVIEKGITFQSLAAWPEFNDLLTADKTPE